MLDNRLLLLSLVILLILGVPEAVANEAHRLLQQKSAEERTIVLAAVVESAEGGCVGIESQYMGMDSDQAAYYRVDCSHGESFMVQIGADQDGYTSVMPCSVVKMIGVDCFEPW